MIAEVKLEIAQKTAELATFEETKAHPFTDLHDDEEEVESNEIVVEDSEKTNKNYTCM